MANTCGFGKIGDAKFTSICIGGTEIVDTNRNINVNKATVSSLKVKKNAVICGSIKSNDIELGDDIPSLLEVIDDLQDQIIELQDSFASHISQIQADIAQNTMDIATLMGPGGGGSGCETAVVVSATSPMSPGIGDENPFNTINVGTLLNNAIYEVPIACTYLTKFGNRVIYGRNTTLRILHRIGNTGPWTILSSSSGNYTSTVAYAEAFIDCQVGDQLAVYAQGFANDRAISSANIWSVVVFS